jgi:hypothetical protein
MLTRDQIQLHINELDSQIPKEDAELLIWQPGESDCEFIGNYIGYLRLGIEMLKAAVVELEPGAVGTRISVNYMEVTDWSLHIRRFIRRENVRVFSPQLPVITWKTHVGASFEMMLGIFVSICLLIGFWEVLAWVRHLIF